MHPKHESTLVSIYTLFGIVSSSLLAAYHFKYRAEIGETATMSHWDLVLGVLHLIIGVIHSGGIVTLWISLEKNSWISIIYAILSSVTVVVTFAAGGIGVIAADLQAKSALVKQCVFFSLTSADPRLGHLDTSPTADNTVAGKACDDAFWDEVWIDVALWVGGTVYVLIATRLAWKRILEPPHLIPSRENSPQPRPILPLHHHRHHQFHPHSKSRRTSTESDLPLRNAHLEPCLPEQAHIHHPARPKLPSYYSASSTASSVSSFSYPSETPERTSFQTYNLHVSYFSKHDSPTSSIFSVSSDMGGSLRGPRDEKNWYS